MNNNIIIIYIYDIHIADIHISDIYIYTYTYAYSLFSQGGQGIEQHGATFCFLNYPVGRDSSLSWSSTWMKHGVPAMTMGTIHYHYPMIVPLSHHYITIGNPHDYFTRGFLLLLETSSQTSSASWNGGAPRWANARPTSPARGNCKSCETQRRGRTSWADYGMEHVV